jgi:hypothetical protein
MPITLKQIFEKHLYELEQQKIVIAESDQISSQDIEALRAQVAAVSPKTKKSIMRGASEMELIGDDDAAEVDLVTTLRLNPTQVNALLKLKENRPHNVSSYEDLLQARARAILKHGVPGHQAHSDFVLQKVNFDFAEDGLFVSDSLSWCVHQLKTSKDKNLFTFTNNKLSFNLNDTKKIEHILPGLTDEIKEQAQRIVRPHLANSANITDLGLKKGFRLSFTNNGDLVKFVNASRFLGVKLEINKKNATQLTLSNSQFKEINKICDLVPDINLTHNFYAARYLVASISGDETITFENGKLQLALAPGVDAKKFAEYLKDEFHLKNTPKIISNKLSFSVKNFDTLISLLTDRFVNTNPDLTRLLDTATVQKDTYLGQKRQSVYDEFFDGPTVIKESAREKIALVTHKNVDYIAITLDSAVNTAPELRQLFDIDDGHTNSPILRLNATDFNKVFPEISFTTITQAFKDNADELAIAKRDRAIATVKSIFTDDNLHDLGFGNGFVLQSEQLPQFVAAMHELGVDNLKVSSSHPSQMVISDSKFLTITKALDEERFVELQHNLLAEKYLVASINSDEAIALDNGKFEIALNADVDNEALAKYLKNEFSLKSVSTIKVEEETKLSLSIDDFEALTHLSAAKRFKNAYMNLRTLCSDLHASKKELCDQTIPTYLHSQFFNADHTIKNSSSTSLSTNTKNGVDYINVTLTGENANSDFAKALRQLYKIDDGHKTSVTLSLNQADFEKLFRSPALNFDDVLHQVRVKAAQRAEAIFIPKNLSDKGYNKGFVLHSEDPNQLKIFVRAMHELGIEFESSSASATKLTITDAQYEQITKKLHELVEFKAYRASATHNVATAAYLRRQIVSKPTIKLTSDALICIPLTNDTDKKTFVTFLKNELHLNSVSVLEEDPAGNNFYLSIADFNTLISLKDSARFVSLHYPNLYLVHEDLTESKKRLLTDEQSNLQDEVFNTDGAINQDIVPDIAVTSHKGVNYIEFTCSSSHYATALRQLFDINDGHKTSVTLHLDETAFNKLFPDVAFAQAVTAIQAATDQHQQNVVTTVNRTLVPKNLLDLGRGQGFLLHQETAEQFNDFIKALQVLGIELGIATITNDGIQIKITDSKYTQIAKKLKDLGIERVDVKEFHNLCAEKHLISSIIPPVALVNGVMQIQLVANIDKNAFIKYLKNEFHLHHPSIANDKLNLSIADFNKFISLSSNDRFQNNYSQLTALCQQLETTKEQLCQQIKTDLINRYFDDTKNIRNAVLPFTQATAKDGVDYIEITFVDPNNDPSYVNALRQLFNIDDGHKNKLTLTLTRDHFEQLFPNISFEDTLTAVHDIIATNASNYFDLDHAVSNKTGDKVFIPLTENYEETELRTALQRCNIPTNHYEFTTVNYKNYQNGKPIKRISIKRDDIQKLKFLAPDEIRNLMTITLPSGQRQARDANQSADAASRRQSGNPAQPGQTLFGHSPRNARASANTTASTGTSGTAAQTQQRPIPTSKVVPDISAQDFHAQNFSQQCENYLAQNNNVSSVAFFCGSKVDYAIAPDDDIELLHLIHNPDGTWQCFSVDGADLLQQKSNTRYLNPPADQNTSEYLILCNSSAGDQINKLSQQNTELTNIYNSCGNKQAFADTLFGRLSLPTNGAQTPHGMAVTINRQDTTVRFMSLPKRPAAIVNAPERINLGAGSISRNGSPAPQPGASRVVTYAAPDQSAPIIQQSPANQSAAAAEDLQIIQNRKDNFDRWAANQPTYQVSNDWGIGGNPDAKNVMVPNIGSFTYNAMCHTAKAINESCRPELYKVMLDVLNLQGIVEVTASGLRLSIDDIAEAFKSALAKNLVPYVSAHCSFPQRIIFERLRQLDPAAAKKYANLKREAAFIAAPQWQKDNLAAAEARPVPPEQQQLAAAAQQQPASAQSPANSSAPINFNNCKIQGIIGLATDTGHDPTKIKQFTVDKSIQPSNAVYVFPGNLSSTSGHVFKSSQSYEDYLGAQKTGDGLADVADKLHGTIRTLSLPIMEGTNPRLDDTNGGLAQLRALMYAAGRGYNIIIPTRQPTNQYGDLSLVHVGAYHISERDAQGKPKYVSDRNELAFFGNINQDPSAVEKKWSELYTKLIDLIAELQVDWQNATAVDNPKEARERALTKFTTEAKNILGNEAAASELKNAFIDGLDAQLAPQSQAANVGQDASLQNMNRGIGSP